MDVSGPHRLLVYEYVPDILERRGPFRGDHLALVDAWRRDGRMLLAGPTGDPVSGALFVLADGEDPQGFVDADPYVANGLVAAWRAERWNVL